MSRGAEAAPAAPKWQLDGTIALLQDSVPHSLVSGAALARVRAAASRLPASLTRCVYLECRPAQADAVDLIVDLGDEGRRWLAAHATGLAHTHASWTRVSSFARAWSDAGGALDRTVSGAWLEFDLASSDERLAPNVFVDFADALFRHGALDAVVTAVAAAAASLDFPLSADVTRTIDQFVRSLPPHAMVLYAGFMLARGTDAVRLCVMGLDEGDLDRVLAAVAWPGDSANVRDLVRAAAAADVGTRQPAIVHFDVGSTIAPAIALEYPLARTPQLRGAVAEHGFLDWLLGRGWLNDVQRSDVLRWPGRDRRVMPHELWPSHVVRRVNHVKLVLADGHTPTIKVYLCAEFVPAHRASGFAPLE